MAAANKSNELKLTRIYNAPAKLVWEAWTDPKQVGHWYGPRGYTITTHSSDIRTGGSWSYTMYGPDGETYENNTRYLEVEQYKKLVYDHGGHDDRPPLFRVTVLFTEAGGKTTMNMTMTLPTPQAAEDTRKRIKKTGGNSTWDRLAEYLDKESTGKERFYLARSFAAPLETMFQMWTDPTHISQWTPPTGFTMQFRRAQITPGGSSFYVMTGPPGPDGNVMKMYGRCEYKEITAPDRIVYTQQFCDETENITRHPMAPTWPQTMLTTITLSEEGPDQTRITIMWEPYGQATAEEVATFVRAKSGMTQGWTGSLDKLEAYLPND